MKVSVLGVPFDGQSSWMRGAAAGPAAIRQAFLCDSSNTFCESGTDVANHVLDQGDVQLTDPNNVETDCAEGARYRNAIRRKVRHLTRDEKPLIVFGGDHSITWPVMEGITQNYEEISILHFDAHPDLYDELDGNRFSHATPMTRIMEAGLASALTQVGIRTMNDAQRAQADKFNVRVIEMRALSRTRLPDLGLSPKCQLYVSIDLDVLDPAFAPGVSHHEPGGLSTRQLLDFIQNLEANVIGADIVELNPTRDLNGVTARVAAKIFKELVAKMKC